MQLTPELASWTTCPHPDQYLPAWTTAAMLSPLFCAAKGGMRQCAAAAHLVVSRESREIDHSHRWVLTNWQCQQLRCNGQGLRDSPAASWHLACCMLRRIYSSLRNDFTAPCRQSSCSGGDRRLHHTSKSTAARHNRMQMQFLQQRTQTQHRIRAIKRAVRLRGTPIVKELLKLGSLFWRHS